MDPSFGDEGGGGGFVIRFCCERVHTRALTCHTQCHKNQILANSVYHLFSDCVTALLNRPCWAMKWANA